MRVSKTRDFNLPAGLTRLTTLRLIRNFRAVDGTTGDEAILEGPGPSSAVIFFGCVSAGKGLDEKMKVERRSGDKRNQPRDLCLPFLMEALSCKATMFGERSNDLLSVNEK